MKAIRVCTLGLGRTGKEIAAAVLQQPDMKLVSVVCSSRNPHLGDDLGTVLGVPDTGIVIESAENLSHSLKARPADVAVDFSTPDAAVSNAEVLARSGASIVIGTTGFTDLQLARLHWIADHYQIGIVLAPNITLGVNVLMLLANLATALLESYDCSIVETHFKHKKDAPSGTAKKIAEEISRGFKSHSPQGDEPDIPIHALRVGGVVGCHTVVLAGENDKLEITHESFSRRAFAQGAMKAVRFVAGAQGCFEMRDVLELEDVLQRYLEQRSRPRHKVLEMPHFTPLPDEAGQIS